MPTELYLWSKKVRMKKSAVFLLLLPLPSDAAGMDANLFTSPSNILIHFRCSTLKHIKKDSFSLIRSYNGTSTKLCKKHIRFNVQES